MCTRSQIDHMHTDSCAMFVCVIVSIPNVSFQQSMFFFIMFDALVWKIYLNFV